MKRTGPAPAVGDEVERRRAEEELDRSFFVEAGAGTGKTTVLVKRIVNLVRTGRCRLTEVAAITFTEKAAGELLHRVRAALEAGARTETDATTRRRLRDALEDVERAPISTIHGLAGSILRERPLEAGVDPGFRTADEAAAALAAEEVWAAWLPAAMARDPEPIRQALRRGIGPEDLRKTAFFLLANRDRITPGVSLVERQPAPDVEGFLQDWTRDQARLDRLASDCRQPEDGAFCQLIAIREALGPARRAAEEGRREDMLRLVFRPRLKKNAGSQAAWRSKESCRNAKALLKDFGERRERLEAALHHAAIAGAAEWLRGFVDAALADRRRRGWLAFQDYLVECRDVLRRDLDVRGYFQERYRAILLDEFQDTDPLQVEIAFYLAEDGPHARDWREVRLAPGKLFLVGDPKQSIYRFRRADIELYTEVQRIITGAGAGGGPAGEVLRIRRNFRSLPGVIDWVNPTFQELFAAQPGSAAYQAEYVALEPARAAELQPGVHHLAAGELPQRAIDARRREADRLADLLHEVVQGGGKRWSVTERRGEETTRRPAEWQDIGVLFRVTTGIELYEAALRSRGIPYRLDGGKEFFRRQEVVGVLSCLEALERPEDRQSILAALVSAVFGHAPAEAAELIAAGGSLSYIAPLPPEAARLPVAASLQVLRELHEARNRIPAAAVLIRLIDATGAAAAAALRRRGGLTASQNLKKLISYARRFDEDRESGGAFGGFARWLRRMTGDDTKEAESPSFEEDDRAVRLLSIHKAKGLEFPITVLVNLGTGDRGSDKLLFGPRGLEVRFGEEKEGIETAGFDAARDREEERLAAEKVRLLYVAATRARDHLVVSRLCHARRGSLLSLLADRPLGAALEPAAAEVARAAEDRGGESAVADALAIRDEVLARPARLAEAELAAATVRPSDAEGAPGAAPGWGGMERARAKAFGSAVHAVLERADLDARKEALGPLAAWAAGRLGVPGLSGEVLAAAARALASPVMARARRARWLRREVGFLVELDGVQVPGAADLVFEDGEGVWIVDWKTDRVTREEAPGRADRYREQVSLYGRAIGALTGKPVRGAVLVFAMAGVEAEVAV